MSIIKKTVALWREYGFKTTVSLVGNKIKSNRFIQKQKARKIIVNSLKSKKNEKLNQELTMSILVPAFNTDADMLKCVIESVINQTYENVEMCIYDSSDDKHTGVGKICMEYAGKDDRVKYKKGPNKGISENTNECARMAAGDYFGLLDHDDILHPKAVCKVMDAVLEHGADFIYTDEVTFSGKITNIISTNFKPDYSPYLLRSNNYICHFTAFSRVLFENSGGFNSEYDGSQDHDLFLRLTDLAKCVYHIPEILYFWRVHAGSVSDDILAKEYAIKAGIGAVQSFLDKKGINAHAASSEIYPTVYRIKYEPDITGKVSIIVLNHEHIQDLQRCVESLMKTTYDNYEILIVENNSRSDELSEYYKLLSMNERIRIITYNRPFNFSEFNNIAVKQAAGEYILFLNNDTEVINPEWLTEMMMYATQKDVGAVGARLFYPDGRLQHCYIVTGVGEDRVAVHAGLGLAGHDYGYLDRIGMVQDVNAVTGACLLMKKSIFEEVDGFDEKLAVAYNDVDLCLKIRKKGYRIIYTPYATLTHFESASRGNDLNKKNRERLTKEAEYIKNKWGNGLKDPYYNPNFSQDRIYILK